MKTLRCTLMQYCKNAALVMAGFLVQGAAAAGALPTLAPPTRATPAAGDFISLLQEYSYDIFFFGSLILAAIALVLVVKNTISTYSLVSEGRASMGQVGMQAGVGVVIVVFIVALLTQMNAIL